MLLFLCAVAHSSSNSAASLPLRDLLCLPMASTLVSSQCGTNGAVNGAPYISNLGVNTATGNGGSAAGETLTVNQFVGSGGSESSNFGLAELMVRG